MARTPFVTLVAEKRAANASVACETLPSTVLRSEALPSGPLLVAAFVATTKETGALAYVESSRSMTLGASTVDWSQSFVRSPSSKSSQNLGAVANRAQNREPGTMTSAPASRASGAASAVGTGGPASAGGPASGPEATGSTTPPSLEPQPAEAATASKSIPAAVHPRMDGDSIEREHSSSR